MVRVEYATMVLLSDATWERVKRLFPAEKWVVVEQLLTEECADNLPRCQDSTPERLERIRFAVLKLSHGSMDRLRHAIVLAKRDWRDILMGAGFGHDIHAHEQWWPEESGPGAE